MTIPVHQEIQRTHNLSSIPVLAIDTDGLVTYANSSACNYLQMKAPQLQGQPVFNYLRDASAGGTHKKDLPGLNTFSDQEFVVCVKPGQERWVLISSQVQHDAQGLALTYLFMRDISALKKKENLFAYLNKAVEELAKARGTARALEQIAQFIVPKFANWFTIDLLKNGQLELLVLKHEDPAKIKWAAEYRTHFPADLSGDTGAARVLKTGEPSYIPVVTEAMIAAAVSDPVQRKALAKIGIRSVITVPMAVHERIDGVITFISTEPERHFDEADLKFACNFARHIGLALENVRLNELAREEIAHRKENESQFRFLADAIPHKLWTSGPDGRATYYNQGWYDYTGITDFEQLREQIWEVLHPVDRGVAAVQWPLAIQSGEAMELEHRFRRYDGMYRWHLTRFTAHKNEFGQTVLWVGTSTDIHEQKIARLRSAEANRELAATNEELAAMNEELAVTNEELTETQQRLQQTIQALETAYEQVRLSKQAAQLGMFDLDLLRGAMEWDERCRSLFGISHQGSVTYENDFVARLHPDDKERVVKIIERAMTKALSDGDYDVEYRTVGADDGPTRWVRAKGKVYFNSEGQPVRFIGSVLDVTEQKHNEAQLKENAERQARLGAIVSTSDDTIVSKTLQGMITSWNAAAQRMFGYTEAEVLGKHISLIIPPERLKEEEIIISKIKKGGKIDHFETVRVAKDGHEVHISLSVSPVMDGNGNIIGASKIARDISKQKEYEEKLQRYTRNVEILNTVGKLVAESLDIEAILQKVTDATTQITGAAFGAFFYNQLDEQGESYMLYTLSGAPREAFEKFGMPRNTAIFNPTFSGEEIVRSADITKDPRYGHNSPHHGMPAGHLPVVSYLAVPVMSKSGSVIGGLFYGHPEAGKFTAEHEKLVAGIANQASMALENAKLYEEVQTLNAKKDEFIGLASHELKTPITSLSGFLQIISNRMPENDINKPFVLRALNQTGKLSTLIGDLLDVTKIEAGQLPLTYTSFDLPAVVREIIEQMQYSTKSHHIAFSSEINSLMIAADKERLEQVIINLLNNAIKYSPGTDLINVSIAANNGQATVRVQDFGMGIAPEQQARIFYRFYRVGGADDHISGLGIGLYISKEIISRHNGQLTVESEIGEGSVFTIVIPF